MNSPPPSALRSLLLLATLFFVWGFLTSMNDILIPFVKGVFKLSHFEAMLVQFAFFGAYFVGSVAYFALSIRWGDPIARLGYQRSAVLGLLVSAAGAALFVPASILESYPIFLGGLFTLGLGFTLLQISANPYVTVLGPEISASSRLNLCQGFNSLGTTIAPLIGGALILDFLEESGAPAEAVRGPYLAFAGALVALAVLMARVRLPRIESSTDAAHDHLGALRFPHLVRGIVAIFCYVGAEVAVGSILIGFLALDEIAGLPEREASLYVSIYWGGLMIGRFVGAVLLSHVTPITKAGALVGIPVLGFFFLAFSVSQGNARTFGETVEVLQPYALLLVGNALAFVVGAASSGRTTGVFALVTAALLSTPLWADGHVAMWCVVGAGLFFSVMWSNVFSLSIEGLGSHKSQASSLLVMAIVGGALLPPLQGAIADATSVPVSFLVPLVACLYLAYFGFLGHRNHLGAAA